MTMDMKPATGLRTGIAVLLLAGSGVLAADGDGTEGMALLEDYLDNVQTMRADFEQSLVDANDVVVETSTGTLAIRRPGQFRWSYATPYEQELVADGTNIWSYDVDLEQVTVKSQAEMLANTPATLLGGSREVLDEFDYVDSMIDERGTVWLTLSPRDTDNGFNRVELGFDDGTLRRMIFSDSLGQTTLIALLDVTLNGPMADSVFDFAVPEGVDLVGVPRVAERAEL
jgi:outer membrane lipoprotein carrier protein